MIYLLCPTYGRYDYTVSALHSIIDNIKDDFEIILLDDHPDNKLTEYVSFVNNATVIDGNGELFWGGGINRLLSWVYENRSLTDDDVFVFFNNDIKLTHPICISDILNRNSAKLVHPALYNEHGVRISAGSKIACWFPFITFKDVALRKQKNFVEVDVASARFLILCYEVLLAVPYIDPMLPHYNGDNDFVLRCRKNGYKTVVDFTDSVMVSELVSGIKVNNNPSIVDFFRSFNSIRSPNSIKYRYRFVRNHVKTSLQASMITFSMTIKAVLAYCYYQIK